MNTVTSDLRREERAIFELRELYEQYGYKKYKMSKFEEYDLYLENKSFLPSSQVITFTDLNGKLLALKPDVTLSIAKYIPTCPAEPEKVYYNENVYRTPRGSHEYKEIMQVGLEYLGSIDLYAQCEVLSLALRSLQKLSESCVMVLSDMGFISGLLEYCALPLALEERIVACVEHKNAHEIKRLCAENGVDEELCQSIAALTGLYGELDDTIRRARALVKNDKMASSLDRLTEIASVLSAETDGSLRLDFSVINDLSYYNGLIFQGFIDGVPSAVLSGGRYDKLMERLGKNTSAMGFAVYVDQLERLGFEERRYDVDVLLLYDEGADVSKLTAAVKMLTNNGQRVRVQSALSEKLRFRQLLKLGERGLEILESND
ncbi:MAG: ATP phosphoribosyltransferase regulatory subunit [Oscillospiraceae bacterium]|nr:ATP phosphoribosyltransferase regulatory subunit [Oscillospiraceae bacterium]